VCELIWVLDSGYGYSKAQIIKTIKQILSTKEFAFEHHGVLRIALEQYEQGGADFSDVLLSQLNWRYYKCTTTFTFDKHAAKLEGFTDLRTLVNSD